MKKLIIVHVLTEDGQQATDTEIAHALQVCAGRALKGRAEDRMEVQVDATPKTPLSPRQHAVYVAIVDFVIANGVMPSIRQLAEACNINSTNGVTDHLKRMIKKGWIGRMQRDGGCSARGIRLLP